MKIRKKWGGGCMCVLGGSVSGEMDDSEIE